MNRHKLNLFPKATQDDYQRLLEDMRANGYDNSLPIMLYQGEILDGWNRYCAASELEIDPATTEFEGDDGAALMYTLRTNKRRNLSSSQWAAVAAEADELLDGIRAAVEVQRLAKQKANAVNQYSEPSDNLLSEPKDEHETKAATKAAELFNTNRTYVNEAAKLKETSPETFEMVKAGEVSIPLASQFVSLPEEVQQEAIAAIAEQNEPAKEVMREAVKKAHVANNSGNNEWYTPGKYIELARQVMGGIDTDPATSEIANRTVKAEKIFTAEDDGRNQVWSGRVWMNPPYAQPLMGDFAEAVSSKFESGEIDQATILVNNGTETQWFQRILGVATAVCFPKTRIKFVDPSGNPSGAPLQGQAILYLGKNVDAFAQAFSVEGVVLRHA